MQGVHRQGRKISFIAIDLLRIAHGRTREDWHLEDNLTLLTQMGLATSGS